MKRIYEDILREHFAQERQMAFVGGPRQVGKTTLISRLLATGDTCLNWDRASDRALILKGGDAIADHCGLFDLDAGVKRLIALDEIHKFRRWKNLLKGFFDTLEGRVSILVTGSARLNVYKRGGDSLMGRYFLYRMHPLSVGELVERAYTPGQLIAPPANIPNDTFDALYRFGGFPEPFSRANVRFYNRWAGLRMEQMFREDLRDLTRVQEIDQLLALSHVLRSQAGALANYSSLAADVAVSVDTIRRWLTILESVYFSFRVRPWFRNVAKSLRKQPKIYPWDWSFVEEEGARIECFVASHLLKSVHGWTDLGLGTFELFYIRDTLQREVDFLIAKDAKPWMMIEVKKSAKEPISPALRHFAAQLAVPYAFQAVMDTEPIQADCFADMQAGHPRRVPARTLLAQLM